VGLSATGEPDCKPTAKTLSRHRSPYKAPAVAKSCCEGFHVFAWLKDHLLHALRRSQHKESKKNDISVVSMLSMAIITTYVRFITSILQSRTVHNGTTRPGHDPCRCNAMSKSWYDDTGRILLANLSLGSFFGLHLYACHGPNKFNDSRRHR
jgi:hypothetical protein